MNTKLATHPTRSRRRLLVLAAFALAPLLLAGCATTYIKADATSNPPPRIAFNAFDHFEVRPIAMGAPYKGQEANDKALIKIQENFDLRVNTLFSGWNDRRGNAAPTRTLLVEPRIQDIKFVNATSRFWGGALAGSSAVVMKVRFSDAATGDIVAEPEFFQRAAAMGGAWSLGATDNNMLVRIADLAYQYIQNNYSRAVGGPTGATPEKK
jgi:hypothetical protein